LRWKAELLLRVRGFVAIRGRCGCGVETESAADLVDEVLGAVEGNF
jgi:hypothetical protein